jgi:hypothetical protein
MSALAAALALALAAPPPADVERASEKLAARPGASVVRARGGGLAHLSGVAEPPAARDPEQSARRFLARHGAAFGAEPGALETVRVLGAPGQAGSAVFRRLVRGLPVFGGEVAVRWRGDGAITTVNGPPALAGDPTGEHVVAAGDAVAAALAAAGGAPGDVAAETGWVALGEALVPVHRVAHGAGRAAAYTFVHAGTGEVLWRAARVRSALPWRPACPGGDGPCIRAFPASPLAPPPPDGGGNPAADFLLQGLAPAPGAKLSGERTAVYDCAGADVGLGDLGTCESPRPVRPGDPPTLGGQTATYAPAADGKPAGFVADPDPTQLRPDDPFAAQNAYFHIDSHSRFLDALDPLGFGARTPAGGVGFLPGYVNVFDGGGPLDNAFFAPGGGVGSGRMVFGQGAAVDLAYDAEVLYHELTHAAIDVTAGFQGVPDQLGVDADPDAINEGSADTFAFIHLGESLRDAGQDVGSASCLARYFGASLGLECLRQARNERTCRGAGPNSGRNPGRTGEVHDDGEIWAGFTWALYEEASRQGVGLAMASALFKALLSAGPQPTYEGFAATVRQAIADSALEPRPEYRLPPAAVAFADCTIAQRDLAGCADRTVALYSRERAQGVVYGLLSSGGGRSTAGQQYFVDVPCGATALRIQSGDTLGAGALYVSYGQPVGFSALPPLTPARYDWILRGNHAEAVIRTDGCAECAACEGKRTPLGAGRWYFAWTGQAGEVFHLGVSIDMADGATPPARPAFALGTCAWGGAVVPAGGSPPTPTAPPALACAAPAAPPATGVACQQPSVPEARRGCGCSHVGVGDGLLALAALLALRRLSRRAPRVHTLRS